MLTGGTFTLLDGLGHAMYTISPRVGRGLELSHCCLESILGSRLTVAATKFSQQHLLYPLSEHALTTCNVGNFRPKCFCSVYQ